MNKAYFKPFGAKDYLCNECVADGKVDGEAVIHRFSPYIRMLRCGYSIYTHVRCIKRLIDGGWVSYLDCPDGSDLTRTSTDEDWDRLYNLVTEEHREII